ncbi:hypothetical protein FF011L_39100 [Roseimaritima multifibrata]|uniref:Integrase SAM-like N-terminal domain-containing protein n=1 Tax=Roseimaritima multifibrata TaxID=1930274 RepID=A0A517MJR7_9BACT|nr:hypothetical protein FF011L_39100 [Roseimaritima multifibrata]
MSVSRFKRRLQRLAIRKADLDWFPRWLDGYCRHHHFDPDSQMEISEDRVVNFLKSLRDNRFPAWHDCRLLAPWKLTRSIFRLNKI